MPLFYVSDVFLTDGSRVSAATVASTAIAAAQWAVTQVICLTYQNSKEDIRVQHMFSLNSLSICNTLLFFHVLNLFHSQTAQNGSGGGQSVDTAVYQQGEAVTYSQEGHEYSGPDGTTFKAQADTRVAALASTGTALMGAYTAGTAPG